jgi:hypothetical protein
MGFALLTQQALNKVLLILFTATDCYRYAGATMVFSNTISSFILNIHENNRRRDSGCEKYLQG